MTPDFPSFASAFSRQFDPIRNDPASGRPALLHQFQILFERWIPHHLLAQRDEGPHSRRRRWTLRLTFWTFLWQVAQAGASCREAVRQAATLCRISRQPLPSVKDSPYCQARAAIPLEVLDNIHAALVTEARRAMAQKDLWCGHRVRIVDGTTVTLPDTPENQAAYPQQSVQRPGCGFPILKLTGLFCLATGLFTSWATGAWRDHELQLLNQLWDQFDPNDLLLADRGFCTWGVLALCLHRGIHAVVRARGTKRRDFRRGQRLAANERLVSWNKPTLRPRTIPEELWQQLPSKLSLRLVRCRIDRPGFRTRRLMLESARVHGLPRHRLSFAGSLAAARRFAEAFAQVRGAKGRRELFADLLQQLADDTIPDRPGRREPRAVKRRPKPYPRLTCHRSRFREIQHQNRYYVPVSKRTAQKTKGLN